MPVLEKYTADGILVLHTVNETPQDKHFNLHIHDFYEIFCFVSGKATYMVEGNMYELRPGTVLIMRDSEIHRIIINGSERYERYVINFSPDIMIKRGVPPSLLAPFINRSLGEQNIYLSNEFKHTDIYNMILNMCEEYRCLADESVLYTKIASMLCSISCVFRHYPKRDKFLSEDRIPRMLINYINDNITSELSIENISKHLNISPTHLSRIFKKISDVTIYQYILSKRLMLAQQYLAQGKKATAVAQECGFNDYTSFFRAYKKMFGCAPKEGKNTIATLGM